MSLTIDLHVLQSVPPSNLTRDDSGSPKSAQYGGVRRARVSSQAWKRATREHFSEVLSPEQVGVRTLRAAELLTARILDLDPALDATAAGKAAETALVAIGLKLEAKRRKKDAAVLGALRAAGVVAVEIGRRNRLQHVQVDGQAHERSPSGSVGDAVVVGFSSVSARRYRSRAQANRTRRAPSGVAMSYRSTARRQ